MFLVISIFLLFFAREILTFPAMAKLFAFTAVLKGTYAPKRLFNIDATCTINTKGFLAD